MKRELFTRTGRSRFLIAIASFVITIIFMVIYNNSQQQLDENRLLRARCEQQHEAANARLQIISKHKLNLEKILEKERKESLEAKKALELKIKAARETSVKQTQDSSARFDSLQQHYKLLQSEHNDLVEECAKTKKSHLEQLNSLERKTKSLQSLNQLMKTSKDKENEEWKLKYQTLQNEKERVDILIKTGHHSENCQKQVDNLQSIINDYKKHCEYHPVDKINHSPSPAVLPIPAAVSHQHNHFNLDDQALEKEPLNKIEKSFKEQQIIAPKPLIEISKNDGIDTIDVNKNSNVFQQPPPLNSPLRSSSTSTQSGIRNEKRALSVASHSSQKVLLTGSTHSSTTMANQAKDSGVHLVKLKQLPKGVAPVPDNFESLLKNNQDESDQPKEKLININEEDIVLGNENGGGEIKEQANNANNRYANVIDDFPNSNAFIGPEQNPNKKDEVDNGAHEIKDADFVDDGKDHLQQALDNINNAAEDENHNFYDVKGNQHIENSKHVGGLDTIDNVDGGDVDILDRNHLKRNKDEDDGILNGNDKLINEVVGDQGKEQAFPDGMHLEEQNEEDEDEDDYSILGARKFAGVAIRN